jgi:hypothetical protein
MPKRTDLSAGDLNGSDRLVVELIEPSNSPPFVAINWPPAATITAPVSYDQVAATAMRILAAALTHSPNARPGGTCERMRRFEVTSNPRMSSLLPWWLESKAERALSPTCAPTDLACAASRPVGPIVGQERRVPTSRPPSSPRSTSRQCTRQRGAGPAEAESA